LPQKTSDDSIVSELIQQTGSTNLKVPTEPLPEDRCYMRGRMEEA
jgi:hypothetical protein